MQVLQRLPFISAISSATLLLVHNKHFEFIICTMQSCKILIKLQNKDEINEEIPHFITTSCQTAHSTQHNSHRSPHAMHHDNNNNWKCNACTSYGFQVQLTYIFIKWIVSNCQRTLLCTACRACYSSQCCISSRLYETGQNEGTHPIKATQIVCTLYNVPFSSALRKKNDKHLISFPNANQPAHRKHCCALLNRVIYAKLNWFPVQTIKSAKRTFLSFSFLFLPKTT